MCFTHIYIVSYDIALYIKAHLGEMKFPETYRHVAHPPVLTIHTHNLPEITARHKSCGLCKSHWLFHCYVSGFVTVIIDKLISIYIPLPPKTPPQSLKMTPQGCCKQMSVVCLSRLHWPEPSAGQSPPQTDGHCCAEAGRTSRSAGQRPSSLPCLLLASLSRLYTAPGH